MPTIAYFRVILGNLAYFSARSMGNLDKATIPVANTGIYLLVLQVCSVQFRLRSVQSLSRVWLFVTPWTAAHQASLSISNSQGLLRLITHFYSLCLSKIHLFLVYFYCIFLEIWDHSVNFFSINPVREFDTLVFSPLQCNFQTHKQVETLHSESPMFPSPALTVAIFKQGFMVTVRTWIMRICVFVICTIFRERRPWWLRW